MKTWNRWIGCCAVASTLTCSNVAVFGQQGYNTSAGSPAPNGAAPQQSRPVSIPAANNVPSLQNNPGLKMAAMPAEGQSPQTKDPYAERPLTPVEMQHLDQLLNYWEASTKEIDRLSCEFMLYQYNSNANFVKQLADQGKLDIRTVKTSVQLGVLRYMKPDKGLYRIDKMVTLTGKMAADNVPEMLEPKSFTGDHWICDGGTVHQYDHPEKKVRHFTIPKTMQGLEIFESPMPFLFGVEAKKLKERYWLRPLPSPIGTDGKPNNEMFVIEAYPKLQQDAANYDHVVVYLDRKEFLPVHLIKYNTEHDLSLIHI